MSSFFVWLSIFVVCLEMSFGLEVTDVQIIQESDKTDNLKELIMFADENDSGVKVSDACKQLLEDSNCPKEYTAQANHMCNTFTGDMLRDGDALLHWCGTMISQGTDLEIKKVMKYVPKEEDSFKVYIKAVGRMSTNKDLYYIQATMGVRELTADFKNDVRAGKVELGPNHIEMISVDAIKLETSDHTTGPRDSTIESTINYGYNTPKHRTYIAKLINHIIKSTSKDANNQDNS